MVVPSDREMDAASQNKSEFYSQSLQAVLSQLS